MSTSSGRKGPPCSRCDQWMDVHAAARDSKCKKCKQVFDIFQAGDHGTGTVHGAEHNSEGWRICYRPCSCGMEYYPDKAKSARPLEPHEYKVGHPGFRPLEEEGASSIADYTTTDYGDTTIDSTAEMYVTAASTMPTYATANYTTPGYATTAYTAVEYDMTISSTAYSAAAYLPADDTMPTTGSAPALDEAVYYPAGRQIKYTSQSVRGPEDPIVSLDSTYGAAAAAAPVTKKKARHVRFDSQGSEDPLTRDEPQPQTISDLADMFAQVDIHGNTTAAGPSSQQEQIPAVDTTANTTGAFEPIPVATEVKNGTIRFRDPQGHKFKAKPNEWQEVFTEEGTSYFLFTSESGKQFYIWEFGSASEDQASGGKDKKGKGKARKDKGNSRKK